MRGLCDCVCAVEYVYTCIYTYTHTHTYICSLIYAKSKKKYTLIKSVAFQIVLKVNDKK